MLIYWARSTTDDNWAVRAAALEAIAQVRDGARVPKIAVALDHEKDVVRFTCSRVRRALEQAARKEKPGRNREAIVFTRNVAAKFPLTLWRVTI